MSTGTKRSLLSAEVDANRATDDPVGDSIRRDTTFKLRYALEEFK